VACRNSGYFNINLIKGRVQGIGYKNCKIIQRSDGYKYIIERKIGCDFSITPKG